MTEVHPTLIRLFMGLNIAALLILALIYGRPILLPFVLAILIAYLLSAMARWLHDLGPAHVHLPMWLSYLLAILIFGLIGMLFFDLVSRNLSKVLAAAPGYQANAEAILQRVASALDLEQIPTLNQLWEHLIADLSVEQMIARLASAIQSVTSILFVILLYVVFALLEAGSLRKKFLRLAADESEMAHIEAILERIGERVRRYVALKTLISLLTGGSSWVVMSLIGIDFAGFWAVLIFALNFIPYVGSIIAVAFPVTLALVQFGSIAAALWALLALTAIQVVFGHLLETRLMGRTLNLSPVVIMLSLVTWGMMWGIVGAVLCVPITVIIVIVLAQFDTTRPLAILLSEDGEV